MTNNTINVPRELLENIVLCYNEGEFELGTLAAECHALLSAPSPAGVDGLVRNFKTREWYDIWDKLCAIKKYGFLIGPSGGVVKVLDIGSWIDRDEAQSVVGEAQCEVNLLRGDLSDAQATIDGLRGENERIRLNIAEYNEAISCYQSERDQQAQRIGEMEGLLRAESARVDFLDAYIVTADAPDTGKVAMLADSGTLRECIDFALSAGKEGE